jgi:hypothetical protein
VAETAFVQMDTAAQAKEALRFLHDCPLAGRRIGVVVSTQVGTRWGDPCSGRAIKSTRAI